MDKNNQSYNKEEICKDFQNHVSKFLVRHKSILDIMSKMEEYNARINRAVVKSVTSCGCISINGKKQYFDASSYEDLANVVNSHLEGKLCEVCKENLELEIGNYLFYLGGICNTLDLDLVDIMCKEFERNETLGVYSLK
ncbi:DUF1573 domain-containing protein [Wansuia hejianensis]|uniref:DUF1573 domain-containing protein n=1 Tax=Wansuia hejianensis TaxID=2763667 RepID=A0A926INF3_9FIRM|nr:DUF1573 domain-containing protein [Wansuia hejianensis]MBC8591616.1 DUF1573 domain-containing protein [Wansuia hejianensis]